MFDPDHSAGFVSALFLVVQKRWLKPWTLNVGPWRSRKERRRCEAELVSWVTEVHGTGRPATAGHLARLFL